MPLKFTLRSFFRDTKPFWEMMLGSFLAALLAALALHLKWITEKTPGYLLFFLIIFASYGLYLVWHFSRLAYGFLEILIGLLVIMGTMHRKPELVDPGLLMVQIAAGMYVTIRGFDNLAQSAPFKGGSAGFVALRDLVKARWGRRKKD